MSEDAPPREKSPQRQVPILNAPGSEDSAFAAFDLFRNYLDSKFTSFKREFSELSELKKDEIVKRIKTDNSYKFKFTGNQKQYDFNDDLLDRLAKISRAADHRDFDTVSELCKSAIEQVRKRNKCIKLADKSPGGLGTVKEYLSDDLASDSDDDKKIRSAENRAIRTRRQRRKPSSAQGRDPSRSATRTTDSDVRQQSSASYTGPSSNFRGYRRYGAQPTDICFACNESGHWRRECPKTNQQSK